MAHIYQRTDAGNTKYPWRVQFVKSNKGERESMSCVFETEKEAYDFARNWEKVFVEKGRHAVDYKPKRGKRPRKWVT